MAPEEWVQRAASLTAAAGRRRPLDTALLIGWLGSGPALFAVWMFLTAGRTSAGITTGDDTPMLRGALVVGGAVFAIGWLVRGSRLGLVVFGLFLALMAGAGAWLVLSAVNQVFDHGPASERRAMVVDVGVNAGKGTRTRPGHATYYAVVRPWREGGDRVGLPVHVSAALALRPDQSVAVLRTRPGRLGVEWVEHYAFEEGPPAQDARPSR